MDKPTKTATSKASGTTPCSVDYFVSDKCRHSKRIEKLNERIKNLENALSFARDCMMKTGGMESPLIVDINDPWDSFDCSCSGWDPFGL